MVKQTSYCIALQSICDENLRHVADELLYRSSGSAQSAEIEDDLVATSRACNVAFYETGIESLCGERKLFFNAPREWLLNPDLLPPNPDRVVIEVLENVKVDSGLLISLKKIKELGYTIALDDFVLTPKTRPMLPFVDIIKLDVLESPPSQSEIDLYLLNGIILLAEKVETMELFERYKHLGCTLFQGYFFSRPEVKSALSVHRSSNLNARMNILKELYRDDVDLGKVEQQLLYEPQIVVRLLKMINSAHYKRVNTITSIQHAMAVVGLEKLRTLVTTLVIANDDPCKMLLLPKVLTRAAMCQKLAQYKFNTNPDEAFIMGLLSMADLMLNQDIDVLCEQLPISDTIKEALLSHSGKQGTLLLLAMKFEKAELLGASDSTIDALNKFYLESRSWATDALHGLDCVS